VFFNFNFNTFTYRQYDLSKKSETKMLDLFTIFSKGGIVLWYFQGTSQLFTNSVNELIKSVILQVRYFFI